MPFELLVGRGRERDSERGEKKFPLSPGVEPPTPPPWRSDADHYATVTTCEGVGMYGYRLRCYCTFPAGACLGRFFRHLKIVPGFSNFEGRINVKSGTC